MTSHAFAALAHIQILVLPVGPIPRTAFEKYAAEIRTFDSIRLGDIPTGMKDERARFMPNPLSSGHLYLSYPSHPAPPRHLPLSLFRPSHFTLGIIGIAACSSSYSLASALEQFENTVLDISPEGSTFPLAKVCFAFEEEECVGNAGLGDTLPGIISIPSVMGNKKLYLGTLLADLCSQILAELGRVYQVLENPVGNEYLNSALFPTLPSPSEMPLSLSSGILGFPSYSSQPELDSSGLAAPNIPIKRSSTSGPIISHTTSLTQRHSTLGPPAAKKRASAVGAVSSHGRLYKVLGDFFLLAGRTEEAMLWYAEAIVLFKTGQDPVWHASALEGMATVFVLDAWSVGQGLQSSVSNNGMKEPWADIYEQLSQAIALYHKAPVHSELSQDYSLLALTYCTVVMRQTSLLFCVWSTKGWGALAFASMLQPGSTSYMQKATSDRSWTNMERLSIVSGVSRSHIANTVSQAHGPWLLHLGPHERLTILQSMASIYSCLGYRRKEAFILREVISCIMDLIVCGREENDLLRKSDIGSANIGSHSENGDEVNMAGKGAVGMRQNEILEGNQSILKLLICSCKVLGVDLEAVGVAKAADGISTEVGRGDSNSSSMEDLEGLVDAAKESFGWPELQVGVIREAIAVAEALPDPLAVARISLSALRTMHSVLASSDQYHLYQTAGRALAVMRRRGDAPAVEYWAGHPIMSLALLPLALHRLPIENLCSILTATPSATNSLLSGITDPFLYNPRKLSGPQSKNLIVQGEPIELTITLRNPYVFDLEIQSISLSTTGVEFECSPVSTLVIPPNTLYPITVVGTAKTRGTLVFRGCIVQAAWGAAKEFLLPVPTDADQNLFARHQSAVKCESGRTKHWGLDSRPWEKDGRRLSTLLPSFKKPPQFLQCVVVPEQPLLRIRWTSLTHGAVMLYNGEESSIRLTLENISALPIDFLRLSFEDSTIGPAQEALSEGELSVFETYETEYDLLHRQALSWRNDKEITKILPNQKVVLSVTCLGKVGCAHGTIHISYSQVNREHEEQAPAAEVFYTRQLSYPVTVTVYHMLECHDLSLVPMVDVDYDIGHRASNSMTQILPEVDDPAEWCLFAVDVRNTYGLPFEVTFEREQAGTESAAVSSTVPPGSMSRIMLPVKKFRLSDDQISQPIPTLSDRQFVVGKSRLSIEEEQAQRELFWYREELLKIISARWKETNGDRHGDLSLRQQRLTLPMLKALRTDVVRVDLTLVTDNQDDGSPEELDYGGGKYIARPNEMLYLRVEVANSTLSPLVMALDLIVDPAEQVLSEGGLSNVVIGKLESEESRDVEVPLYFLCTGRFEIGAEVRILGAPKDSRAGASRVCISVREDG
ncbi:TRAPP II complex [Suillus paluster]|uniref:TRAPP II complex n=1 Tax=Suillus paluster TaxID=48578 RepID=UPI001B86EA37|nr:TRAPP II complex [Suillus paluster]KAG1756741.1 TRAPP II complex [Suillus paluster]